MKAVEILKMMNEKGDVAKELSLINKYILGLRTNIEGKVTAVVSPSFKQEFLELIKSNPVLDRSLNNIDSTKRNIEFHFDI